MSTIYERGVSRAQLLLMNAMVVVFKYASGVVGCINSLRRRAERRRGPLEILDAAADAAEGRGCGGCGCAATACVVALAASRIWGAGQESNERRNGTNCALRRGLWSGRVHEALRDRRSS